MLRHIFFFIFVVWFLAQFNSGCTGRYAGTLRYGNQTLYSQAPMYYRPVFSPPPGTATLYSQPRGWSEDNPLSIRVVNDTSMYARCFLNGREIVAVSEMGPANKPLLTQFGIRPIRVIPPETDAYQQLSRPGHFILKCQLFSDGGDGVIRLVKQLTDRLETNGQGREFFLHNVSDTVSDLPFG